MKESSLVSILLLFSTTAINVEKDEAWIEVRSPNFRVISNGREKQAMDVALGFERIRAVFVTAYPYLRTDSGAEVIVVAPRDERTMKMLLPRFWEKKAGAPPAGLFRKGWEKDYAIVRLDAQACDSSVVYHEYVHKLLGLNFPRMPIWLREGVAEFYGNAKFLPDRAMVGLPSARLDILRGKAPFPLKEILAARGDSPYLRHRDKIQMFYAQSWGLTHMLMVGEGMGNGRRFNEFMTLLHSGADDQDAFRQAFGEIGKIEDQFRQYVRQFSFTALVLKDPVQIDKSVLSARKMSMAETHAALGGLYTASRELEKAKVSLEAALAADPGLASAHENIAFLYFQEGRDEQALREFEQALTLNPNSYLALYYKAVLANNGKSDEKTAKELNDALGEVLRLNSRFAPAVLMRSRLYLRLGDMANAVSAAQRAAKLEPDRAGYHTNAAQILILQGDFATAAKMAKYVAGRWNGPDCAEALAVLAKARSLAEMLVTPEEQAREERFMKYAADTSAAEGIIESVSCDQQRPLEVVIATGDQKLAFRFSKVFGIGWSDTLWYGSDHFSPCHHVKGLKAVVRYKPSSDKEGAPEINWFEIRNDVGSNTRSRPVR
jgi:tetratricopeptide (TPR) repeat protein